MKTTLLIIALFLVNINIYSQGNNISVELKPDTSLEGINFSCLKVLDGRYFKENIGFVTRGSGKNNTGVQLLGEFEEYLAETITKLLPRENEKPRLVLIIRDITISENIGTMTQIGFCNVEIEFTKQIDTVLYSLGIFHANMTENKSGIKYSHDKRILMGLEMCFRKFDKTDWIDNKGILIEDINRKTLFDFKIPPPKGAYISFNQMAKKTPLDSISFDIIQANKSKKYEVYSITTKKKINIEPVHFVSDGESIYLRVNRSQFIKSKSYGKYIYFEGRVTTTVKHENAARAFGAGLAFGLGGIAGGVIFSLATGATSNNSTLKGVVLETETGNLKMVTDMYLHRITTPFPLMLKEYRKSKRKLTDKEKVITQLNTNF